MTWREYTAVIARPAVRVPDSAERLSVTPRHRACVDDGCGFIAYGHPRNYAFNATALDLVRNMCLSESGGWVGDVYVNFRGTDRGSAVDLADTAPPWDNRPLDTYTMGVDDLFSSVETLLGELQ
jgi:hypothetical protein